MPKIIVTITALLALFQPLHAVVPAWEKEAPETVADLLAIQKQVQKVLPKCMAVIHAGRVRQNDSLRRLRGGVGKRCLFSSHAERRNDSTKMDADTPPIATLPKDA